jgi:hypothetical protein
VNAPYEFSISKGRMMQLVLCFGVIQILLYGSGVATGWVIGPRVGASSETLRARAAAESMQVKDKRADKQSPEKQLVSDNSQPSASGNSSETKTSEAKTSEANAGAVSPAPSSGTSAQPSPIQSAAAESAIPQSTAQQSSPVAGVAVQVASFRTKSTAVRLADLLKKQGYGPVLVGESSPDGTDTWHYVQLGPYKEWDEASRIVAELDRSYEVHAYVRPIRNAVY